MTARLRPRRLRVCGHTGVALVAALSFWSISIGAPGISAAEVLRPDPDENDDFTRPFTPVDERRFGLGTVSMYLRYAHARDAAPLAGMTDLVMGGLAARGIYGSRIGYGFGLGLELGAAGAPGFGFHFDFYPSGVAVAIGPTGFLGLFLGLQAGGVTGRVPYSLTFPAELRLELDITRHARLGALVAVAWAPVEAARRDGSELFSDFADESLIALTARFGKTFPRYGSNMGRGYFFRLERREQMKTVLLGVALGVEIDIAH
ncbi:MAG: hypothetical protein HUU21_27535 [Polyangiaceae bacterium]|nr:hypothetical protein [Polyangiaceae bacterium]NUQ77305.1 hypothetical protein [Polyangiaceae bacterium]